ncbi:MAG: hypothetical protein F4Y03_08905 [Alphaproteobacteria bacterium]|nr:hypothetical protein [Alphaproteobacteria bacterium]
MQFIELAFELVRDFDEPAHPPNMFQETYAVNNMLEIRDTCLQSPMRTVAPIPAAVLSLAHLRGTAMNDQRAARRDGGQGEG